MVCGTLAANELYTLPFLSGEQDGALVTAGDGTALAEERPARHRRPAVGTGGNGDKGGNLHSDPQKILTTVGEDAVRSLSRDDKTLKLHIREFF